MSGLIEIYVGDVNNVEARVFARFVGDLESQSPIAVRGTLSGPYCEGSHTLPAKIMFRDLAPRNSGVSEAIVPDPCIWSPDLPHLYEVDVEAVQSGEVLATYRGSIGLWREDHE